MNHILFNHIAKTGGRSIIKHFNENLKNIKFLSTEHILDTQFKKYENENNFIFTILRNPINRYVSVINYINTNIIVKINVLNLFKNILNSSEIDLSLIEKVDFLKYNLEYKKQITHVKFFKHDKIYKYENGLNIIIKDINEKFNINIPPEFPNINTSDKKYIINDLSLKQISLIKDYFKEDFLLWEKL